jgi:hypothetical protein
MRHDSPPNTRIPFRSNAVSIDASVLTTPLPVAPPVGAAPPLAYDRMKSGAAHRTPHECVRLLLPVCQANRYS